MSTQPCPKCGLVSWETLISFECPQCAGLYGDVLGRREPLPKQIVTPTFTFDQIEASKATDDVMLRMMKEQDRVRNQVYMDIIEQCLPPELIDATVHEQIAYLEPLNFQLITFPGDRETKYLYISGICMGAIIEGYRDNEWFCRFDTEIKR